MNKCGNIACECDTELIDQMCSEFCNASTGGDAHAVNCECGHAQCKQRIASEIGAAQQ